LPLRWRLLIDYATRRRHFHWLHIDYHYFAAATPADSAFRWLPLSRCQPPLAPFSAYDIIMIIGHYD
jgi:hypothetical protein